VKVKLYMFPGSNAVLTGRLMLEHKGLDYKTFTVVPAAHAFQMLALGFPTMGVPALKVDGRRVQGTRQISRVLDELVPERPLFPSDLVRRKAVERAERWGEEFQNATRRIFYSGARRDPQAFPSVMTPGRPLPTRAALRMISPLIVRLATGAHRASDEVAREDLMLLPEHFDQIEAWIAAGVLDGAELNAADFQIAVNLRALLFCEDLAPFVQARPALERFARRVAPDYPGHLRAVLPEEWLTELRESVAHLPVPAAGAAVAAMSAGS
jgi:glutathione S-transferase